MRSASPSREDEDRCRASVNRVNACFSSATALDSTSSRYFETRTVLSRSIDGHFDPRRWYFLRLLVDWSNPSQTSLFLPQPIAADILLDGDSAAFLGIVLSDTVFLLNCVMVIFVLVAVFLGF
jgi:hypothetical protein